MQLLIALLIFLKIIIANKAVTALVENGGLWWWIVADNRRLSLTVLDSFLLF